MKCHSTGRRRAIETGSGSSLACRQPARRSTDLQSLPGSAGRVPGALRARSSRAGSCAYHLLMNSVPEKTRRNTGRVIRPGDERVTDLSWASSTPGERMAAAWNLTLECLAMQGVDPGEPRLKKSVVRIQRSWR